MRGTILGLAALTLAMAPDMAAARKATPPAAPPPAAKAPATTDQAPAAANKAAQPAAPGWRSRCEAAGRNEPLTCVVEETAVVAQTGQVLVGFSIRVSGPDSVALIQIPVGVFLPNGLQVQIDDGAVLNLPLQTCEQRGCFAGANLAPDVVAAMRAGKSLKVSFANLSKQTLTVTLPLNGFGPAYDKIK